MVNLCQKFASNRNLKFSTNTNPEKSKTKCLIFSKKVKERENVLPILLNGVPLPWVEKVKHLGSTLQLDNSMEMDIAQKRGKFIGKMQSLLQEFHYVEKEVFVKIMNIYTTSFYGSCLWDLFSSGCDKLYKSWNVAIRQVLSVDRCTHRYLIEKISRTFHPKVMLASRLVNFHKKMTASSKLCVRLLARLCEKDLRTVLGKTLNKLCDIIGSSEIGDLTANIIKKNMTYYDVPDNETWRVNSVTELIKVRDQFLSIPGFTDVEVKFMLDHICTSALH